MLILGIDLETQSLDPHTKITEIGAGLFRSSSTMTVTNSGTEFKYGWPKEIGFSHFCYEENYAPQTQEIIELTGITDLMLKERGHSRKEVILTLLPLMRSCDAIMAHNKAFDQTVLENTAKEVGVNLPEKEWICTNLDIDYPKKFTCHKLSHLALDHGISVDPSKLHRAENDVDLMMALVSKYNIDEILAFARSPWILLKAKIRPPWVGNGGDGGIQKEIAQKLGFSYEKIKYLDNVVPVQPKTWIKRIKECKIESLMKDIDVSSSPFQIERV